MATSGITDNIVISDPKMAEAFAEAVEAAEKSPLRNTDEPLWFVESKNELRMLMKRRKDAFSA